MMVTEINVTDYLAMLETRRVLDRLIAGKAAKRATPDQRAALGDILLRMKAVAKKEDTATFMRLDRACDELLELASRNPYAANALTPLHAHCRRFWYCYQHESDLMKSAKLHESMIESVIVGNEQAAARDADAIIDYLESFARSSMDLL